MRRMSDFQPIDILRYVTKIGDANLKDYTYIILGQPGPTGKTWLTAELLGHGFKAFEITNEVFDLVLYRDDKNHFIVDDDNKKVVIVLNRWLTPEEQQ